MITEKERRIYYQDIVYNICNQLDKCLGKTTVCGTVEKPTTEVQDKVALLIKQKPTYRIGKQRYYLEGGKE